MRLRYGTMQGTVPSGANFGDDLNPWLFNRLFPNVFDDDDTYEFWGIGTILHDRMHFGLQPIVFGTGHGLGNPPEISDSWTFYCVRGPLTAKALDLPQSLAVTDPAILCQDFFNFDSVKKIYEVSYVPQIFEIDFCEEIITNACRIANCHLIDPRLPIEQFLQEIAASKLVVCEAMHGAIVADAFRVPWIPFATSKGVYGFKWKDWLAAYDLNYEPVVVRRLARLRRFVPYYSHLESALIARKIVLSRRIGRATLSSDKAWERRSAQMRECASRFREDIAAGRFETL